MKILSKLISLVTPKAPKKLCKCQCEALALEEEAKKRLAEKENHDDK